MRIKIPWVSRKRLEYAVRLRDEYKEAYLRLMREHSEIFDELADLALRALRPGEVTDERVKEILTNMKERTQWSGRKLL